MARSMHSSTMLKTTLKAKFVFPVASPPLENAYVTFGDGLLQEITTAALSGTEVLDLGDVCLLPGLVNTHCHLEFSSRKQPYGEPGTPLPTWIRDVIGQRPSEEQMDVAIAKGLSASLAAGVTTVAEIARRASPQYAAAAPQPRLVLLQEAIGFSNARTATATIAASDAYDELQALAKHNPAVEVGLSPHAPYTASLTLVNNLVELANKSGATVAMHVAESPEELEFLNAGTGPFHDLLEERGMWCDATIPAGTKPLAYLAALSKAERSLVVHGNYLDDDELNFMAANRDRMSLVYCPRTHHHFRHPRYPLPQALAKGARVVAGTDGCGSNPDLSLLSELRYIAAQFPDLPSKKVLEMGTITAADALGLSNEVGSLQPGLAADLIAIPTTAGNADEALIEILSSEKAVTQVWRSGVPVSLAT